MIHIYMLSDPREPEKVRYVGQTREGTIHRLARHISEAKRQHWPAKNKWLRGLLEEGIRPSISTLEMCESDQEADAAERRHIHNCRSMGDDLLNLCSGGAGVVRSEVRMLASARGAEKLRGRISPQRGCVYGPEIRARMSAAKKGRPEIVEHMRRIRQIQLSQPISEESHRKRSASLTGANNPHFGKHHSVEARKKISDAAKLRVGSKNPFYGKKLSPEHIDLLRRTRLAAGVTDDTRRKLGEASKRSWATRRARQHGGVQSQS